jgi:hypothetical protein
MWQTIQLTANMHCAAAFDRIAQFLDQFGAQSG